MGCRADRKGRERDAAYGQKRYWAQIEAELAPAHVESGAVYDRRQHDKQHELWSELYWRQTRREREEESNQNQKKSLMEFSAEFEMMAAAAKTASSRMSMRMFAIIGAPCHALSSKE